MNVLGLSITRADGPSSRAVPVVLLTAAAVVAATGTAYAVWSVQGSGSGSAVAGSSTALTISGVSVTGSLVPGGSANVQMTITNNNKANASISSLSLSNTGIGAYTDATFAAAQPGCSVTGVTWTSTTKSLTPVVIAANGGSYTLTLTNMATMDTTSDNGCQSAVFKMPVSGVTATLVATAASSPTSGAQ